MSQQKLLYTIECGHVALGHPFDVEGYECPEHGPQRITGVHVHEWRVKCKTCSYARWCGLARVQALFLATRHKRDHGSHDVGDEYIINPTSQRYANQMNHNRVLS